MTKITINNKVFFPTTKDEFEQLLININNNDFLDIWIEGFEESSLCVMINKTKAFLMYLRYPGDCGYSSRDYSKKNNIYEEFKLSNGQVDSYPENWTVDRKIGFDSLKEYYKTGKRLKSINWGYDGK